jgi:hypothetical protein
MSLMATVLSLQNELAEEKRKTKCAVALYFQLRSRQQLLPCATSDASARRNAGNRASVKEPVPSDAKRLAKKQATNRKKRRTRRQAAKAAAAAQATTTTAFFVMKPSVLGVAAEPAPSPTTPAEYLFAPFVGGGIALSPGVVINAWRRQKYRQTGHLVHRGLLRLQ